MCGVTHTGLTSRLTTSLTSGWLTSRLTLAWCNRLLVSTCDFPYFMYTVQEMTLEMGQFKFSMWYSVVARDFSRLYSFYFTFWLSKRVVDWSDDDSVTKWNGHWKFIDQKKENGNWKTEIRGINYIYTLVNLISSTDQMCLMFSFARFLHQLCNPAPKFSLK